MDKEISKGLFEVENPVYQDFDDMMKKYFGYIVVMTNVDYGEHEEILGGTVRYYTKTSRDYIKKWGECIHDPQYENCLFYSFIPRTGSLGGLFL